MTIHPPSEPAATNAHTIGSPAPASSPHASAERLMARADWAQSSDWGLVECARALYRSKTKVAWITASGILAAALVSLVQPRVYQSTASLEIQPVNENYLDLKDVYPTAASTFDASGALVQTQVDILQQDALLGQVAEKLRLSEREEFQRGPALADRFRRAWGLRISPADERRNAVDTLRENLEFVSSRTSRVIQIVASAREPELAAAIANTLAETFIEQSTEARRRAAEQTRDSLLAQLRDWNRRGLQAGTELRGSRLASGQPEAQATSKGEAGRRFYEAMAEKAADAGVASAVAQAGIRILSPAEPTPLPYKPNVPLNLAIGTFGGFLLAIGAVMLREQGNGVVRMPGEASMYLTLPELGAIPNAGRRAPGALLNHRHDDSPVERAALEQRFSGVSESFRATLASILSRGQNGDEARLFVVTSSRSQEGKTTVVSNLGIALSEISNRVLLIDGDMRSSRLHRVFDQPNSWGLSDVLGEQNAIEELELEVLVKKTSIPHLYLLPSGACTDNIFRLLCSPRMARLLPRFRQEFDYVIVDAPPCLEFADARILARHAEQLLLVVRADYTDTRTAQAAVQRLLLDRIPVMGVILNRWDPARAGIYGDASYYGVNGRSLA
ncbi:MAG TPA: polysaccharide biosynthesis tyrosine autokinase [Bryobacteraceae bacterium]|nr:polysaccharide biosynthesis tyrosine autokinase [Bryobacteraceae bacterium]